MLGTPPLPGHPFLAGVGKGKGAVSSEKRTPFFLRIALSGEMLDMLIFQFSILSQNVLLSGGMLNVLNRLNEEGVGGHERPLSKIQHIYITYSIFLLSKAHFDSTWKF